MLKYNIYNFKVGDKVIVNDNMKKWVEKETWSKSGLDLIGRKLTITEMFPREGRGDTDIVNFEETDWWVPIQCLDPIDKEETISVKWYKKGKLEK